MWYLEVGFLDRAFCLLLMKLVLWLLSSGRASAFFLGHLRCRFRHFLEDYRIGIAYHNILLTLYCRNLVFADHLFWIDLLSARTLCLFFYLDIDLCSDSEIVHPLTFYAFYFFAYRRSLILSTPFSFSFSCFYLSFDLHLFCHTLRVSDDAFSSSDHCFDFYHNDASSFSSFLYDLLTDYADFHLSYPFFSISYNLILLIWQTTNLVIINRTFFSICSGLNSFYLSIKLLINAFGFKFHNLFIMFMPIWNKSSK